MFCKPCFSYYQNNNNFQKAHTGLFLWAYLCFWFLTVIGLLLLYRNFSVISFTKSLSRGGASTFPGLTSALWKAWWYRMSSGYKSSYQQSTRSHSQNYFISKWKKKISISKFQSEKKKKKSEEHGRGQEMPGRSLPPGNDWGRIAGGFLMAINHLPLRNPVWLGHPQTRKSHFHVIF